MCLESNTDTIIDEIRDFFISSGLLRKEANGDLILAVNVNTGRYSIEAIGTGLYHREFYAKGGIMRQAFTFASVDNYNINEFHQLSKMAFYEKLIRYFSYKKYKHIIEMKLDTPTIDYLTEDGKKARYIINGVALYRSD